MLDPVESCPRISVLMPTYNQAAFICRALESLRSQTLSDWELIVIDDGSTDETRHVLEPYLADRRMRYLRSERNEGLGAALNRCVEHARGRYVAYLPSDDLMFPAHLQRLADLLDARPEVYLAYGGVRRGARLSGPTLHGADAVGREAEALEYPPPAPRGESLTNGNLLALVQVVHRREHETQLRWPTRAEVVSDGLEPDYWRALLRRGARFAYAGAVSCEWVDHPHQRHKIIAGAVGGLARYRRYYGVGGDTWLNFQPSRGMRIDERARYGRLAVPGRRPAKDGLKILLVGSLGFNPERIVALEERGHQLYGLWHPDTETWDMVGPLPYANVIDVAYDGQWIERVRAVQPDVIYALLNWQVLPMIAAVHDAGLDAPLVFHYKEGPFIAIEHGTWPLLRRLMLESAGRVLISPENRAWYELALDTVFDPSTTLILDGDLPKIDWMTDDWAPKLSERDGAIHTVCPGRPLGLDPFDAIAAAGIHVHFYGEHFHEWFPNWTRAAKATGFMHLHPTVEPERWVAELSRYDAAWLHVFRSENGGDLRRAQWDDLNVPARLGTFAAAGLPWIIRDNRPATVAVQQMATQHDVGVFFDTFDDLASQLRDRQRLARLTANMRAARHHFAFDTHVDDLITLFRNVIAGRRRCSATS